MPSSVAVRTSRAPRQLLGLSREGAREQRWASRSKWARRRHLRTVSAHARARKQSRPQWRTREREPALRKSRAKLRKWTVRRPGSLPGRVSMGWPTRHPRPATTRTSRATCKPRKLCGCRPTSATETDSSCGPRQRSRSTRTERSGRWRAHSANRSGTCPLRLGRRRAEQWRVDAAAHDAKMDGSTPLNFFFFFRKLGFIFNEKSVKKKKNVAFY